MTKLSIDLNPRKNTVVSSRDLQDITMGCLDTLHNLRELGLGDMVEVFRVTWVTLNGILGPQFTIHFHDPMGEKSSYGTDFRFIGSGSAEEIVHYLCSKDCLPKHIREHVTRCEERLKQAQQQLERTHR